MKDLTGTAVWRPSVIVGIRENEIMVHYMGWESKWDEWIPKTSERIQRFRGMFCLKLAFGGMLLAEYDGLTVHDLVCVGDRCCELTRWKEWERMVLNCLRAYLVDLFVMDQLCMVARRHRATSA